MQKWLFLIFALSFILFAGVSINAEAQTQSCGNDGTECAAYCHLSEGLGCDSSNYLLSFGYKYCHIYLEHESEFLPQTQAILQKIRPCLIESLKTNSALTCDNAEVVGESSHYTCYMQNGFCDLPLSEMTRIFIYAKREVLNLSLMKLMGQIVEDCETSRKSISSFRE